MAVRRYSVQYQDASGQWVHWQAEHTLTHATRLADSLAVAGHNARVKDTQDWQGPALVYRERKAQPGPVPRRQG